MSIKSERYLVDLGGGKLRKLKKNEGLKIWVENWEKDKRIEIMKRKVDLR